MSTRTTNLTNRSILLAILSVVVSCDSFTSDSIKPENLVTFSQTEFYTLPNSAILIDLGSMIEKSFSDATLSVSKNPQRGTLTPVDAFMLKYRPAPDFKSGEDHITVSVMNDGKLLTTSTLTIKVRDIEEFSCGIVAIEDKIKLKTGSSSVVIGVLENDWFCDIDASSLTISIHTPPKFGRAIVENESIVYTPGPEYKYQDEIIYQLTSTTGESSFYGLVSIADRGEFTIQQIAGKNFRSLSFVDENTGFLGTTGGIYKTTNGGTNWNVSVPDSSCTSILFLDENKGFAVIGSETLITTDNGGVTWETLAHFEYLYDILFISETAGFIVVSDHAEEVREFSILKTGDGGLTWKKVLSDFTWGFTDIKFVNPTLGYVVFSDQVFVTTDAGDTWSLFLDRWLTHFETTVENEIFAVTFDESTQSTIITSEDGHQWNLLVDFSYSILSFGFAPSAEVGFAATYSGGPYRHPFSVHKTVDHGKTWVKLNPDEALYASPTEIFLPSNEVVYFLCSDRIIKYTY